MSRLLFFIINSCLHPQTHLQKLVARSIRHQTGRDADTSDQDAAANHSEFRPKAEVFQGMNNGEGTKQKDATKSANYRKHFRDHS
jgi:hypothetical protein